MHTLRSAIQITLATLLVVSGLGAVPASHAYPANSKFAQLIPNELYVTIYDIKIPPLHNAPAWTLVTDGLKRVGQDELILTIVHAPGAEIKDVPRAAMSFFTTVHGLAKEGKLVHAGGRTRFGENSSFLTPQFKGFLYVAGPPPDGVLAPLGSLTAVPVTSQELDAAEIGGALRVMSKLSLHTKHFPFPYWCDLGGKSTFTDADIAKMKQEPITRCSRTVLAQAGMVMSGDDYHLHLNETAQNALAEILKKVPPEGASLLLWLGMDSSADAQRVWSDNVPTATAAPGSAAKSIGGNYLLLLPGVEKNEFGPLNDGYAVTLTKDAWAKFRTAVLSSQQLELSDQQGKSKFIVDMIKSQPIAKRSMTNEGGYVEYSHGKTSALVKPVLPEAAKTNLVVLMTNDGVIKQSISTDDLAKFVKDTEKAVVDFFSRKENRTSSYDMIVQANLKPRGKTTYKIFHRPSGIPDQIINDLYSALAKVPAQDPANEIDLELVMKVSL